MRCKWCRDSQRSSFPRIASRSLTISDHNEERPRAEVVRTNPICWSSGARRVIARAHGRLSPMVTRRAAEKSGAYGVEEEPSNKSYGQNQCADENYVGRFWHGST